MIGRLINQGQVVIFGSLLASAQVYQAAFVITNYVIIMYFSFKFNFGNDPTVSAPVKGLCCKPTVLISEKIISCIFLILFVLAFFPLFAHQFLRFCPFNLSKSLFEMRMQPLVHWLPQSSFPVVGFQSGCFNTRNHRTTGNRMIRKARNKWHLLLQDTHDQAQFSYYINKIILFFVLQVSLLTRKKIYLLAGASISLDWLRTQSNVLAGEDAGIFHWGGEVQILVQKELLNFFVANYFSPTPPPISH